MNIIRSKTILFYKQSKHNIKLYIMINYQKIITLVYIRNWKIYCDNELMNFRIRPFNRILDFPCHDLPESISQTRYFRAYHPGDGPTEFCKSIGLTG